MVLLLAQATRQALALEVEAQDGAVHLAMLQALVVAELVVPVPLSGDLVEAALGVLAAMSVQAPGATQGPTTQTRCWLFVLRPARRVLEQREPTPTEQ